MAALIVAYAVVVAAASCWVGARPSRPRGLPDRSPRARCEAGDRPVRRHLPRRDRGRCRRPGLPARPGRRALWIWPSGLASRSSASRCCDECATRVTPAWPRCCERSTGRCAGAIGALVVATAWIVMLSAFVAAAGIALGQLTGWSHGVCVAVAVVILLLYAMPGGMRAVTATNLAHLATLAVLIAALVALAAGHAATVVPASHGAISWGYLVGIVLLSAPTTIVAPDVMMGSRDAAFAASGPENARALSSCCWPAAACCWPSWARARPTSCRSATLTSRCRGSCTSLLPIGTGDAGAARVVRCRPDRSRGRGDGVHVHPRRTAHGAPSRAGPAPAHAGLRAPADVRVSRRSPASSRSADTQVVGLVLTAFRVFVPGIVPQAVLPLPGGERVPARSRRA